MAINTEGTRGKGFGDRVKATAVSSSEAKTGTDTQAAIDRSAASAQETMMGVTQMMGASVVHGVNQVAQQRETLVNQGSDALARLTDPQQLWADTVTQAAVKLNANGYTPLFTAPLASAVEWPQPLSASPVSVAGLFPPMQSQSKQLQSSEKPSQGQKSDDQK